MKQLFLASEIDVSASHIASKLDKPPAHITTAFILTAGEVKPGDKRWIEDRK